MISRILFVRKRTVSNCSRRTRRRASFDPNRRTDASAKQRSIDHQTHIDSYRYDYVKTTYLVAILVATRMIRISHILTTRVLDEAVERPIGIVE